MAAGFPAGAVTSMREREVEIHHADLGLAFTRADWPPAFCARLLDLKTDGEGATGVLGARDRPGPEMALWRG